jgi:antitoxin component YwqK of YwqJK toxin-antitoxin module
MSTGVFGGSRGWRQQEICLKERIDRHKDGSIKAKGHIKEDEFEGHWEWFRKDGSMRSGYFADGKQMGEWTTCDATGKVVKVTKFSR